MNVIPAIDLKEGKCVRLFQGDFSQTTEYSNDPTAVAREFAKLRATDLHVVDLDGARTGTQKNRSIIEEIASESNLAVQLGGGIRTQESASNWFSAGVSRCVIGSLAITEPALVQSLLGEFGGDRIVLALDVNIGSNGVAMITTHGWTRPSRTSLYECIDTFKSVGLRHVLCTDVSRDGAMAGPNIELYSSIIDRYPDLQLQASGGVRDVEDLVELRRAGIPAAITGRALLDGKITATELVSFQQNA